MVTQSRWLWTIAVAFSCSLLNAAPPIAERGDQVDEYHGEQVADPYRWLEADVRESPEVADWVAAQNAHTNAFLEAIPQREAIRARLTELFDFEKFSTPFRAGGRIYYEKNDGLQNQYVLYVQDSADSEPRVLIDPNTWSEDGTIALGGTSFSDDGRYLAYAVSEAGSDWEVWKILEIATGTVLDDELRWIKFNGPSWTIDGEGFFYARFPEPSEGAEFQDLNLDMQVYYHRVGQPQSADSLVFARPDEPEWGYDCTVTEDGRYLVITVFLGTDDRCQIYYRDLYDRYAMPQPLVGNFDNEFSFVGNEGETFYFITDLAAPRKRLVSLNLSAVAALDAETRADNANLPLAEIIPQQPEVIESVGLVGNQFVVETLKDAQTQIAMYTVAGTHIRNVDLPGIGSASGFYGKRTDTETYYAFSSFDTPTSIYRYDLITGASELFRQAKVNFDPARFQVTQVFYESKDGTRVPMFLAHKKDLKLDGNNPTLLYGYGGFAISMTPYFSISKVQWMEMGGVFAMACIRGGGEYGEEWHKGGAILNKQRCFDDFIAAAEWLIDNKYTQPKKLAIQGGSNGGLLVGACLTQRPELYGACLPEVGVMDMLRFQHFTAGRYWVDEYGSSEDAEQYAVLKSYSPYHNIRERVCYPPTMVVTADTDDRVIPGHSFKFTAALQYAQSCNNPILIRIESRAGHGAGTPTTKLIDELTDMWSFLYQTLEMTNAPGT
jgi:prolyl oligopeptidase